MSRALRRAGAPAPVMALVAGLALAQAARGETLAEALAAAYETNPGLQAQRAALRSVDEDYAQAYAGLGPNLSAQVQDDSQNARVDQRDFFGNTSTSALYANTHTESLSLTQPLYTGGRTTARLSAAQADVMSGRQQLRGAEIQLLQGVIGAYMDVRRDEQLLALARANIGLLRRELSDAEARASAREVTVTDVAQAHARLASAEAQLSTTQGRLAASRAAYLTLVGRNPGALAPEPELPGLPADLDAAFDALETGSPAVLAGDYAEQASRARVAEARAANRPNVSLRADLSRSPLALYQSGLYDQALTVQATLQQPLFTAGLNASLVRQAIDRNARDRLTLENTRRTAVQNAAQAWDQLVSARKALIAVVEQVRQAKTAYEGARIEEKAGLRTTIDVLNAEQELQAAQSTLIQLAHDGYVAEAGLLAVIGRLEIAELADGEARYDPARAFRRVARRGSAPWQGAVLLLDGVGAPRDAKPAAPRRGPAPQRPVADALPPRAAIDPDLLAPPVLDAPVQPAPKR